MLPKWRLALAPQPSFATPQKKLKKRHVSIRKFPTGIGQKLFHLKKTKLNNQRPPKQELTIIR